MFLGRLILHVQSRGSRNCCSAIKRQNGSLVTTNTTWDNLHAEMHALQQAIEDGLIKAGDTVELAVTGKMEVCKNCRAQLAKVAEKLELRTMTVVDHNAGVVYYWREGMDKLLPLSKISE